MKFNMGCGHRRLDGFVNVDASPPCAPDALVDLEALPWPWPDSCAEEVVFHHALEHLGEGRDLFLAIIQELYRICADGCVVNIAVPHPRHDNFLGDPTHVRAITPAMLALFDHRLMGQAIRSGSAQTPLARQLAVDFETVERITVLDEPYLSEFTSGSLLEAEVRRLIATQSNIASEFKIKLRVHKPIRPDA